MKHNFLLLPHFLSYRKKNHLKNTNYHKNTHEIRERTPSNAKSFTASGDTLLAASLRIRISSSPEIIRRSSSDMLTFAAVFRSLIMCASLVSSSISKRLSRVAAISALSRSEEGNTLWNLFIF